MNIEHCDAFECFLHETILNEQTLVSLYETACAEVEPLAQNVIYTEEDDIQDAIDDCWDNVWINPLTGIPHYHAANLPPM